METQNQSVEQVPQTTDQQNAPSNVVGTTSEQNVNQGVSEGAIPPDTNATGPVNSPDVVSAPTPAPAPIKPASVGRIVTFFPGVSDTYARTEGAETNAAVVVQVLPNNELNLRVFNVSDETPKVYKNVPNRQALPLDSDPEQFSWDWPEIK